MKKLFVLSITVAIILMSAAWVEKKSATGTFTVSNLNDSGTGSLRQAIIDANNVGGGTIDATGVSGTIDLLMPLPNLDSNIILEGPGATTLTIERSFAAGTPNFSVFIINSGKAVSLNGVTIQNGSGPGGGGGIYNNFGILFVYKSVIANNTSSSGGGGIFNNFGNLIVNDSTIANNTTSSNGGGIIINGGTGTINGSTISGNVSNFNAGGVANTTESNLRIYNSTIANNTATGGFGGGIVNGGTLLVSNSTIANNTASIGGGIANLDIGMIINLQSAIVAKNFGGSAPDVFGTILSSGHNLIGNTTGSSGSDTTQGDLINVAPLFELDVNNKPLLKDNGGRTQTIALLCGSPAIDHGKNTVGLLPDQRGFGFVRTYDDPSVSNGSGDGTDIGAFEVQQSCNQMAFDLCLQDDSSGNLFQINSSTGEYQFTTCNGITLNGIGELSKRGNLVTLQHMAADRRIMAKIDVGISKATATIQTFSPFSTFTITDRDTTNNTCTCR